jgi:hypothetical protein
MEAQDAGRDSEELRKPNEGGMMARLRVFRRAAGVVLLLAAAGVAVAQTWTVGTPTSLFHLWRFDGEYFPGTGMVYFLGGRMADLTTTGAVYSFDPVAGTYAATSATMATPISNYDICLLEDDYNLPGGDTWGMYIFAGRISSGDNTNAVQVYYPRSNTVRTVTTDTFPGKISGNMYSAQASVVYNNKAYVFGGFYATTYLTTPQTWVFDPLAPAGTRWTQLSDLPWSGAYFAGAVVDSMIYAIGGDSANAGAAALFATVDCAALNGNDPASSWVPIASLPQITDETRAFGFNYDSPYDYPREIIVAGQGQWPNETPVCYRYDVGADSWNSFPSLNVPRRNHAGAFIPGNQNSGGIPGMWVWNGRGDGGDSSIFSVEYLQMTSLGVSEGSNAHLVRNLVVAPLPLTRTGRVSYELAKSGNVRLVLFDVAGRSVATLVNGRVEAGPHSTLLDAHQLKAGVYLLRLDAAGYRETRKVVVQ